jgi:hypothetical protein
LHSENESEPDLSQYYPVSNEIGPGELPNVTIKNIGLGLLLLGIIAFIVNALMVFLFMSQEWAVIWPRTSGAQFGVVLMVIGGIICLTSYVWERRSGEDAL